MKTNQILKSVLIVIATCFFNSCSNDDTINNKVNEVKVNSKSFEISNATIIIDGTYNGITELELYLTSSGITISENVNFTGSGDYLYLRLYSDEAELIEGNYLFNNQDNAGFLLSSGYYIFNYDISQGDGQSGDLDIESGNVSVSIKNEEYIINISLEDEAGDRVTGYYKGALAESNYSI